MVTAASRACFYIRPTSATADSCACQSNVPSSRLRACAQAISRSHPLQSLELAMLWVGLGRLRQQVGRPVRNGHLTQAGGWM
jgi:hypothetical protein